LRHIGDAAVGVEVGVGDVLSVELQQQIGPAGVGGGIAAARVGSIDHARLRGFAQYVDRVEIAMTQTVAFRHVDEAAEQVSTELVGFGVPRAFVKATGI
jgi:hypothetical protein